MSLKELSSKQAVSIITCTKRRYCMDNLINNFLRQRYKHKELIIILNHHHLKIEEYKAAVKQYRNIKIYSQPEQVSLGHCLNYGVQMAKHPYIAKFDDDDYYAPSYLADSMRTLQKSQADIVGKRAHFMYLSSRKLVLHRYHKLTECYVSQVQGATLLVKREVFDTVSFPDQTQGECVKFCALCRKKGFKIYSGNPYHFFAVRRKGSKDHTWIVSDQELMSRGDRILKLDHIKKFVSRR
ncbi:glycosyltransferase family A protein [Paenibacillus urinalis]|uniref:Glycosyltransferase family A protein n=1 Tax=Paenibacillus urinalis TaxID=521520 RepID=A0ABY7X956_9BACL|nr:glycosyltransferase family A protein [Paenibacillus urinalis]WDH98649.1 glycosyltransferase family A protein [Paenibacillus urinalis]WDI02343.1 glycosyltransferase family A protein [Paenibacillus urinalis]